MATKIIIEYILLVLVTLIVIYNQSSRVLYKIFHPFTMSEIFPMRG